MPRYALLVIISALLFVWAMPKIIGLRYALLGIGILLALVIVRQESIDLKPNNKYIKYALITILILTSWIYLQAVLLSEYTARSLQEINGQWLIALLAGFLGYSAAKTQNNAQKWIVVLFCVFGIYVLYTDLFAVRVSLEANKLPLNTHLFYDYKTGGLPSRVSGLCDGMDKNNYITNLFFGLLAVELFFRAVLKKRILPVDNFVLFLLALAALFSSYLQAVRNGALAFGAIGLTLTWLAIYVKKQELGKTKTILTAFIVPFAFAVIAFSITINDNRWKTLIETVPIALDTQNNKAWINAEIYQYPKLSNGESVSASNYERIAWIKKGIEYIAQEPFGYGYDRNAFGYIVKKEYPNDRINGGGHSHSGIIDLLLSVGILGGALWLLFLAILTYVSFETFTTKQNFAALALMLIVGGFFFRSFLDSNIRDHSLESFLFLCGLLGGLVDNENINS